MNDVLRVERQPPLAVLTLARPLKRNAIDRALGEALDRALHAARRDAEIRTIVLAGEGERAFSAGADLSERNDPVRGSPARRVVENLLGCEKPTIAAVHGYTYGAGAYLALACDLRVGARSTVFRIPGSAYGLVVAARLLAHVAGPAVAKDILFTARPVPAEEAFRLGLLSRLVEDDRLLDETLRLARTVAAGSPAALAGIKRLADLPVSLAEGLLRENDINARLKEGADHRERIADAARRVLRRTEPRAGATPPAEERPPGEDRPGPEPEGQ